MSSVKINLTDNDQFLLFRALVCQNLSDLGFKGDAWVFSESLDMSFDCIKDEEYRYWKDLIKNDASDYKRECPEDFAQ